MSVRCKRESSRKGGASVDGFTGHLCPSLMLLSVKGGASSNICEILLVSTEPVVSSDISSDGEYGKCNRLI